MGIAKPSFPIFGGSKSLSQGQVLGLPAAEGSGNVLNEATGLAANGSLTDYAMWVNDQCGYALSLNGSSESILVPHSPALDFTGSYAVAMWAYPTASTAYQVFYHRGGTNTDIALHGFSGNIYTSHNAQNGGSYNYLQWNYPTLSAWTRVLVVYDSPALTWRLYYNGAAQSSTGNFGTIANPLNSSSSWEFGYTGGGTFWGGFGQYWSGRMDAIAIWNRTLSTDEVAADNADAWQQYRVRSWRLKAAAVAGGGISKAIFVRNQPLIGSGVF